MNVKNPARLHRRQSLTESHLHNCCRRRCQKQSQRKVSTGPGLTRKCLFQTLKESTSQRFLNSRPSLYLHGRGLVAAFSGWGCFPVIDFPQEDKMAADGQPRVEQGCHCTTRGLPVWICHVTSCEMLLEETSTVSHAWGNAREKVALEMLHGTELGNSLHGRSSCRCSKPILGHEQVAIRAH